MHELLPYVNIFLPNIEELKNLTAQSSIEKAITSIQKLSLTIVVKNGNTGAMFRNHQEVLDQPSFLNTDVIDAIGAGDTFNAGFIHPFLRDQPPAVCLEFGALCGAINTTASGGTTAFADLDTVRRIARLKFNFLL